MLELSFAYINTLKIISHILKDLQYCIRGTSSLVLQGIDMNVDDIDIICDKKTALEANELFKDYVVDPVSYKELDKFKSYFGKFNINSVQVEFMGDWQIKDKKGIWSKVYDGSNFNTIQLTDFEIKVSTVQDELNMFLAMGRFTAYQKIRKQLQSTNDTKLVQPTLFV